MTRYRLVKKTKASGFSWWVIERKVWILGWIYVDSYMNQDTALTALQNLRNGMPLERREIIDR